MKPVEASAAAFFGVVKTLPKADQAKALMEMTEACNRAYFNIPLRYRDSAGSHFTGDDAA